MALPFFSSVYAQLQFCDHALFIYRTFTGECRVVCWPKIFIGQVVFLHVFLNQRMMLGLFEGLMQEFDCLGIHAFGAGYPVR